VTLQPGEVLSNGHYHILRPLGSGGFGSVYLAQDTLLREEVAIKELVPGLAGDRAAADRGGMGEGGARDRRTNLPVGE
jgi:serine/threonine protein kinase